MSLNEVPFRLYALLLGACCVLPLAGCDRAARASAGGNEGFSLQPLAEREQRHFDLYQHYRGVFDRPRRPLSDALQDDVDPPPAPVQFISGDIRACSFRGVASD